MESKSNESLKLCYVSDNFAYFTTSRLDEQWGDDWGDAPYEHNAGEPYNENGSIFKVAYFANLLSPSSYETNSPFSVKDINEGKVAWLRSYDPLTLSDTEVKIMSGASLDEFIKKVESVGGTVYLPSNLINYALKADSFVNLLSSFLDLLNSKKK